MFLGQTGENFTQIQLEKRIMVNNAYHQMPEQVLWYLFLLSKQESSRIIFKFLFSLCWFSSGHVREEAPASQPVWQHSLCFLDLLEDSACQCIP